MFGEIGTIIGQILSIVAVITGVISFQMKTSKGILFFQIITALVFATHYFLIGAITATMLNFIGAIQCVCYYIRNRRQSKNPILPIFFTTLVVFTSLLTWDGWYSIFIMLGLLINSIGFASPNAQIIRRLNLIKSPLCLVYNLCVSSVGGIIFETASMISTAIGLVKNNTMNKGKGWKLCINKK